ncbi:MAG TPA: sigma-70 family RNA polymerase sigma factor [Thermoanaerobaculia bacterium]|nr:sigma-70 family RNA polymerase sigma factor [Thermoanaerobaculia bacterium]
MSHDDRTDEELLALAKAGDEAAFGDFVNRHVASVHRWMIRAVGQENAEDMTQDVFLKAYRGLPRFRGEAPPRAWLASIADNAVKNRYRSLSRFRRVFAPAPAEDAPGADPPERAPGPEEQARAGEGRRFVAEALKLLPAEFRMPVVLRDLEEWSYDEIAVSLHLPIGTVKSRIARGRGQLKILLSPMLNGTLP